MQTRSMTYVELAAELKIVPDSARKLARRRRWARSVGNDGRARILVPVEQLSRDAPRAGGGDAPGHVPGDLQVHELQRRIAVLEAELAAERRRADDLALDRDAWRDQAQRLAGRRWRWPWQKV